MPVYKLMQWCRQVYRGALSVSRNGIFVFSLAWMLNTGPGAREVGKGRWWHIPLPWHWPGLCWGMVSVGRGSMPCSGLLKIHPQNHARVCSTRLWSKADGHKAWNLGDSLYTDLYRSECHGVQQSGTGQKQICHWNYRFVGTDQFFRIMFHIIQYEHRVHELIHVSAV